MSIRLRLLNWILRPDARSRQAVFVWFPLLVFLFPHLFLLFGGYRSFIMPPRSEFGFVEIATAVFLLIGGVYALSLASVISPVGVKFGRGTLITLGLGFIWMCLEELNYGQLYLEYSTPEWFRKRNEDGEMNVHNFRVSGILFMGGIKIIGYIFVATVGILAPLYVSIRKIQFPISSWFHYFVPSPWLIPASLLHLFANLPKQILKHLPNGPEILQTYVYFSNPGEYEEYMFGVWILLYLVLVHHAIKERAVSIPLKSDVLK